MESKLPVPGAAIAERIDTKDYTDYFDELAEKHQPGELLSAAFEATSSQDGARFVLKSLPALEHALEDSNFVNRHQQHRQQAEERKAGQAVTIDPQDNQREQVQGQQLNSIVLAAIETLTASGTIDAQDGDYIGDAFPRVVAATYDKYKNEAGRTAALTDFVLQLIRHNDESASRIMRRSSSLYPLHDQAHDQDLPLSNYYLCILHGADGHAITAALEDLIDTSTSTTRPHQNARQEVQEAIYCRNLLDDPAQDSDSIYETVVEYLNQSSTHYGSTYVDHIAAAIQHLKQTNGTDRYELPIKKLGRQL